MICIGFTLVTTMYQLTMSLKIVLGEITVEQMNRRNLVARILVASAAAIYGSLVIFIETVIGFDYIYFLWITYFSLLSGLYILVIFQLNSKMKRLAGNFNVEIASINRQFIVFLFAYLTRLTYEIAQVSTDENFSNIYGCIFVSSI